MTTRNSTGKPRALHLNRNSADCPKQTLRNTIGTGKTQRVSGLPRIAGNLIQGKNQKKRFLK